MLEFVKYKKIYYVFSGVLVIASIASLIFYGLNLGIDFKGGSLMQVEFLKTDKVIPESVKNKLEKELGITFNIQPLSETELVLRFQSINQEQHEKLIDTLKNWFTNVPPPDAKTMPLEEILNIKHFTSIGPIIGEELKQKAFWAISIVIILIILYIAWAFRKIKSPFKYGLIAIIALVHDVLITLGIFSFLHFEINTAFIAALLTILGYSVNDTIVVFDRIRENIIKPKQEFSTAVNQSINQTLKRSLFTSLTTLLVLFAIFFFGGVTIKSFILALIIGIISGTYSSIFLASPLLTTLRKTVNIKQ